MTFRIVELDRLYARSPGIRLRDRNRSGGNLPDIGLLQALIRSIHVAHDNGHMLEPKIVAVGGDGDWPPGGWRNIAGKLDGLLAELQVNDAHVDVEHALHPVIFASHQTKIRALLELQY